MLPIGALRYGKPAVSLLRWLPGILLLLPWLLAPGAPADAARIRDLAGPYSFRLLDWETVQLAERAPRVWTGLVGAMVAHPSDADTLRAYFQGTARPRASHSEVEAALERLVGQAYRAGGVGGSAAPPFDRLFPPVLVALTPPPNVFVIAPRTELRVVGSSVIQAMDVTSQERLEASADSTNVSALIAPIGGLATYPSMVLDEDAPDRVLAAVAHEWLHQYLIFYPLGAGYWSNQETREINETTAEIIGQEVGGQLADNLGLTPKSTPASPRPAQPAFDFRAFMRETRAQTDQLLKDGQVDSAESYMRTRRDELQQHGIQIRKLNQAYFALYGSYGEGFAASPSNPIPALLRTLRAHSPSLGDFIFRIRGVTTVAELRAAVQA
jgi:hypothetical protein